jgi:hypothetical protein
MKRTVPLIVLIGTAGLLLPILGASGESPSRPDCKAQWASGCSGKPSCDAAAMSCSSRSCCTKAVSKNDPIVGELTAILNETKSAETFLVTTMVLGRLGAEAKPALPAIIRNAERLELFEDMFDTRASADNPSRAAQQEIGDALEMILGKKVGAKGRIGQISGPLPTPAAYPVPCAPVCPAPAVNWNAPAATPAPAAPPPPVKPTAGETLAKPLQGGTVVN